MIEHITDDEPIIPPKYSFLDLNQQELKKHRKLLFCLAWEILRYQPIIVGALWILLQPFYIRIVFALIFSRFVYVPTKWIPYSICIYPGLLIWIYFSNALSQSSNAFVLNDNLLSSMGYQLSAICVKYWNIMFILPFYIQLLMFMSQVIYLIYIISENLQQLLYLNILIGLINAHHACIF